MFLYTGWTMVLKLQGWIKSNFVSIFKLFLNQISAFTTHEGYCAFFHLLRPFGRRHGRIKIHHRLPLLQHTVHFSNTRGGCRSSCNSSSEKKLNQLVDPCDSLQPFVFCLSCLTNRINLLPLFLPPDTEKRAQYIEEERQMREENIRLQRKLQREMERREALCRQLSESESSLEMDDER